MAEALQFMQQQGGDVALHAGLSALAAKLLAQVRGGRHGQRTA